MFMSRTILLSFFSLILIAASCKKAEEKPQTATDERTYFSIREFALDQWLSNKGQPYSIVKKVYFNGQVDSLYTNAIEMEWSPVFKSFFETDISDAKFVGKYDFSAFEEPVMGTKNFFYEANDPKLFTRKVQIVADNFSNQVTSIYIEAEKNDRMGSKTIKLFYDVLKSITIQEFETSKTGERKELRVVYEFR